MDTSNGEEDLFFPDLAINELAIEKLKQNLRIQFVVSRIEAILLRWVISSFQSLNLSSRRNDIYKFISLLTWGSWFLILSTWITIFQSRARHVLSFYLSYYSKIQSLEDNPYSKNKRCKVVTIYGDPSKLS